MRGLTIGILAAATLAGAGLARPGWALSPAKNPLAQAATPRCPTDPLAPAVTPKVEFDNHPLADGSAARFGSLQYPRGPIKPYEVALTIDDGPDAALHQRVLDILDQHCLKATFFFVGRYVNLHPEMVRNSALRGHVVATHSLTHPNNLRHYSHAREIQEIAGGFAAAQAALVDAPPNARAQLAPFFRFPGLNGSPWMLGYLGQHRITAFSSDFGVDDWKRISAAEIERRGLLEASRAKGGIVIVHETKPHMVEELSAFIEALERKGYRFVQVVPAPGDRAFAEQAPDPLIKPER